MGPACRRVGYRYGNWNLLNNFDSCFWCSGYIHNQRLWTLGFCCDMNGSDLIGIGFYMKIYYWYLAICLQFKRFFVRREVIILAGFWRNSIKICNSTCTPLQDKLTKERPLGSLRNTSHVVQRRHRLLSFRQAAFRASPAQGCAFSSTSWIASSGLLLQKNFAASSLNISSKIAVK